VDLYFSLGVYFTTKGSCLKRYNKCRPYRKAAKWVSGGFSSTRKPFRGAEVFGFGLKQLTRPGITGERS